MDRVKAYGEYHRCLTELEALGSEVTQADWLRCERPGWSQPRDRLAWGRRLRSMKRVLRRAV